MMPRAQKVAKLARHERSARAIGSIHEADAFAAKIKQLGAGIGRRWRRQPGQRPSDLVFYQLLHSHRDRERAYKQVVAYISELERQNRVKAIEIPQAVNHG